jgi:outer membrane protein assembly factor BamB
MYQDSRRSGLIGESKSGRGLTAVYHDGKVMFRGQTSLYCVDAETGKLRWKNDGEPGKKGGAPGYSFGDAQAWSTDHSPVVIDGVLLVRINDTPKPPKNAPPTGLAEHSSLVAIDPDTGKLLWRASNVIGSDAIPISIVLGGKTYIVTAYSGIADPKKLPPDQAKPEHQGMLSLIEPRTGKIIWRKPVAGPMANYPVVWEDIVAVNVEREKTVMNPKGKPEPVRYWGALRVSVDDAKLLWKEPKADWQYGRSTSLAHHGVFINDSRETGFQAIEAKTGKIIGQYPHIYTMAQGSHNWTWAIASNHRIFTSGQYLLMFRLKDGKMELMPGNLPVDLASGYVCPIRPALADGRLFVRTGDGLACYDLRKPVNKHRVDSLRLSITDLALGMAGKGDVDAQIRLVNGAPDGLVVRFPAFQNTGVARPYAWGGINAMRWRSGGIPEFKLEGSAIRGQTLVRVNEHHEPWDFDLTIGQGGDVTGTCTRNIPASAKPINVQGAAAGDVQTLADGRSRHAIRLAGGGITMRGDPADVTVYVEKLRTGELRAYAGGGRINQASFEADPGRLTLDDKTIRGPLTVIVHSDRFGSAHPDRATALALTYDLDAAMAATDGKTIITGKFTGVVGAAYRKTAQVTGKYHAGQDLQTEVEADADVETPDASDDNAG